MHVFPADLAGVALAGPVAGDPVADLIEFAELLDVDVQDLAWVVPLVAADRLGRFERRHPAEAEPAKNAADRRRRHADRGGDRLAGVTLPAQSLDRRAHGRRSLARR
jgi:hypothetical protein